MASIDNETIKLHLRTLYSGQKYQWQAFNAVCGRLEIVLKQIQTIDSGIPAHIRTSLYELYESVQSAPIAEAYLDVIDSHTKALAADSAQFQTKVR